MDYNEKLIELSNVEIFEYCILNIDSGKKSFYKEKQRIPLYTGAYFKDEKTFFALYPTKSGPMIYYKGKEYPIKKRLHITLHKNLLTKVKYFEVSFKIISSIYFGVQQKGRHYIPAYINS